MSASATVHTMHMQIIGNVTAGIFSIRGGGGSRWTFVKTVDIHLNSVIQGYGLDDQGFESRQGLGIFLFTTASRPALGLIQPPIQWVPRVLTLGIKRPGREANHSPPSRD
jgi:hypothetical protein